MMQRPNGWDDSQAYTGEFPTIPPGGYVCRIINAEVLQSRNGHEMLSIKFDIADGMYAGFYNKLFKNRATSGYQTENKWPGVFNQLTGGNSLPFFKGLITCVESSNPGYQWDWEEKTLAGKLFGGLFGREEYFNIQKGEYVWTTKLFFIRSVETIERGNYKVPDDVPAKDKPSTKTPAQNSYAASGRMAPPSGAPPIDDSDDDDLPF